MTLELAQTIQDWLDGRINRLPLPKPICEKCGGPRSQFSATMCRRCYSQSSMLNKAQREIKIEQAAIHYELYGPVNGQLNKQGRLEKLLVKDWRFKSIHEENENGFSLLNVLTSSNPSPLDILMAKEDSESEERQQLRLSREAWERYQAKKSSAFYSP